jgi:hypothetical protein
MRSIRAYAALAITALALLAPAAHADPPAPAGDGKPVWKYILDFVPMTYWDKDGKGQLLVIHVGNDPNNDTPFIKVQLKQNGKEYVGSGVLAGGKMVFSIGPYIFQTDGLGWGSYHIAGYPNKLYWVYTESGLGG